MLQTIIHLLAEHRNVRKSKLCPGVHCLEANPPFDLATPALLERRVQTPSNILLRRPHVTLTRLLRAYCHSHSNLRKPLFSVTLRRVPDFRA